MSLALTMQSILKPRHGVAKGHKWSLYLDGHDSHLTRVFLEHFRENKISVVCFIVSSASGFSPLKLEFGKQCNKLLGKTGEPITKENFLKVYGAAHLKVLTPELIKTAFQKTGIVPFNHNVITKEMMVPSCNTSYKVFTSVAPSTPVRIITDLLIDAVQPHINMWKDPSTLGEKISPWCPVHFTIPELTSTDITFLTSSSPIKSSSQLPNIPTIDISPVKYRQRRMSLYLLTMLVKTPIERRLQEGLVAKQAEVNFYKENVIQLQSQMVLQRLYCG